MAKLSREEYLKAHVIQFSALYCFGVSYEVKSDGEKVPQSTQNMFDFLTNHFWGIRIQKMTYTGKPRKKTANKEVSKLWNEISTY